MSSGGLLSVFLSSKCLYHRDWNKRPTKKVLLNLFTCQTKVYDVIAGTFFLCRAPAGSDRFESLTEEQAERYTEVFHAVECFVSIDGELCVIESD